MAFKLPPLPFAEAALEPHVSRQTMAIHHGKHHAAYVEKLNALVSGKPYENMNLEEVVRVSARKPADRAIFNNAAQAWNHAFFWDGMRPGRGGEPEGEIAGQAGDAFGGYTALRREFVETAMAQFGSGWAWLVLDGGRLAVTATSNADSPLLSNQVPLLVCDVWEHAYYLDYQNRRKDFVEAFLDHLVDWESVAARLREAQNQHAPKVAVAARR